MLHLRVQCKKVHCNGKCGKRKLPLKVGEVRFLAGRGASGTRFHAASGDNGSADDSMMWQLMFI